MALSMKEKYARVDLSKLPEKFKKEFVSIKEDSENFDPELVDIFKENFDDLYALTQKKYPEAIKAGGTIKKTKPTTVKKPVAKKTATTKPAAKTELKGYSKAISEATGVTDQKTLDKLEEYMREDIFHSTLDWQSKAEFAKGAMEAVEMYNEIHPDKKITVKGEKKFTPKSRGMKKAGYTGEIKKGDVFLWKKPGPYAEVESETEVLNVDEKRGEVVYMEGFSTIGNGMEIDRFRKGIIKKVGTKGMVESKSKGNEVEECKKILNEAGFSMQKKKSKDGKKSIKVKAPRQDRTIIKDKVKDTFTTITKDISGSKEKDEKYKEVQKRLNKLEDLMSKFFNRISNLAEDNSTEKIDKIIKLLEEIVG